MREITRRNCVKNREKFIIDKCNDKRVLHLGCCDAPYTNFKFGNDKSLFQRIEKVAESQKGLDIDNDGLEYISSLGHDVSFFDLNNPEKIDFNPEIIIFADTLEHLMNLQICLSSLKGLMNENVELIITVPNATMFERFFGNFKGHIQEHPDHKISFTYSALKQLLIFNDLAISGIFVSDQLHLDKNIVEKTDKTYFKDILLSPFRASKFVLRKILVTLFPLFSECLIVVCKTK